MKVSLQIVEQPEDCPAPKRVVVFSDKGGRVGKPQHWFQICAIELNELISEPGSIPDWQEIVSGILGIKINMGIP